MKADLLLSLPVRQQSRRRGSVATTLGRFFVKSSKVFSFPVDTPKKPLCFERTSSGFEQNLERLGLHLSLWRTP